MRSDLLSRAGASPLLGRPGTIGGSQAFADDPARMVGQSKMITRVGYGTANSAWMICRGQVDSYCMTATSPSLRLWAAGCRSPSQNSSPGMAGGLTYYAGPRS